MSASVCALAGSLFAPDTLRRSRKRATGAELSVASEHAGVNVNLLTDDLRVDPLSGTSVLNGVEVSLAPA